MADAQIGLGLAALGRPAYINLGHGEDVADPSVERMERTAHEVLDAAYEGGVRWFDAARSYGRAEDFLASWLASRGPAAGRRHGQLEVGLSLHGRLARRRGRARGQGPVRRALPGAMARDPRAAGRLRRALPDPFGHARQRRARRPRRAQGARRPARRRDPRRPDRDGGRPGRHDRTGARHGRLRRRPGDLEPPRALSRRLARACARGRTAGAGQGGARQRAAHRARRRSDARGDRSRAGGQRGRGRARRGARTALGGRRAQRSGDRRPAREQPRRARTSPGTRASSSGSKAWPRSRRRTGLRAPSSPGPRPYLLPRRRRTSRRSE